jgi:hypothetical protein
MQNLNFTPKLLRQRRFLSFLLPLFALFVGLGSSQSVLAQASSTVVSDNVTFNRTQAGTSTTGVYDTQSATAPPVAPATFVFNGTNFGTFNLASDAFTLSNASFTINQAAGENYDQAQLRFRVFQGDFSTATGNNSPPFTSITLTPDNAAPGFVGLRTYTLSASALNVLAAATTGGNPGTTYRFDIRFVATDNGNLVSIASPIRNSIFTATGAPVPPTSLGNSDVFIDQTSNQDTPPNTGSNLIYGGSSGRTPLFQGANLGTYDINTGQLTLNGGDATTVESNGDMVQKVRLIYQIVKPVQPATATSPATTTAKVFNPSNIALTQVGPATTNNGATTRLFSNNTAFTNLIAGLANFGTGKYNITVRYEADILRNGSIITINDPAAGGFTASFNTIGVPIITETWTGMVSDDYFNAGNWDLNFVPDGNTNIIVPAFGTTANGTSVKPYPNINAGVTFTDINGNSVNNTNSGPALARDVILQGSTQAQRSIARLVNGRWKVFGSFTNQFDSFIQRSGAGTVLEFAGTGNQTISGGTFTTVEISGGGTKALTGVMNVSVSMTFLTNGGMLTTDISKPDVNVVVMGDRSVDAPNGAMLFGERDDTPIPSYIRGFARTKRTNVLTNELGTNGMLRARVYGNLGMTILFTGSNNPGDVDVTRNTVESYTPLVTANGTSTARYGIRRIFGVRPSSPTGLVANLTFRYLDSELNNLGPQGNASVPEPNLALFVSTSAGSQFGYLGRDALDQTANILTKNNVRTFATFTLGDMDKPLPVSLTGFDAKRIGADALVTWQTASEQNNKGFNVQVSSDGKTYRNIGFVASEVVNTNAPMAYTFTDTEKNKAGVRYYRLEQVDISGKSMFFAPRVVTFEGKAVEASSSIVAYPNPLSNETLHLSLNSTVSGTAVVRILDMTGRQVGQRDLAITIGTNDVTLEKMSELKSGLYILNVMLPSGEKKTMKVTKQ